jgi:hypothetical protein
VNARLHAIPPLTTHELNVLARAVGDRLSATSARLAARPNDDEWTAYWTDERHTLQALATALAEAMP